MMRRAITTAALAWAFVGLRAAEPDFVVPREMIYCGMKLKFTDKGRAAIQMRVDHLVQNKLHHRVLVERSATYLPYVMDAFKQLNAPTDLCYIAIQESGLKGDAVSTSNAVGFWQFKDFSAREVKLEVNEVVDERKHIFRSSVGAARYFYKNYRRHANWVYAVISYYAGGTGALPYIDSQYMGKDEMVVTEGLHWYAQKAIAHKIAFEPYFGKVEPQVWLEPYVVGDGSERVLVNLAKRSGVELQEFRAYNLWICSHTIPADGAYSYYVPRKEGAYAHRPDPFLKAYSPETGPPLPQKTFADLSPEDPKTEHKKHPHAHSPPPPDNGVFFASKKTGLSVAPAPKVRELPIEKDPYYDREFVVPHPTADNLVDIAQRHGVSLKKLQKWNQLTEEELRYPPQKLILLVPPRKANVHVATKLENLHEIAIKYKKNIHLLMNYNRMDDANRMLLEGQKIYLRDYRPGGEPPIVYLTAPKEQPCKSCDQEKAAAVSSPPFEYEKPAPPEEKTTAVETPSTPPVPAPEYPEVPKKNAHIPVEPTNDEFAPRLVDRSTVKSVNPAPAAAAPQGKFVYYTVQPQETMYSISKKFGMTVEELRTWNGMCDYNVKIGQKLKVKG